MGNRQTEFVMYSGLHTIGGVNMAITYGNDRVIFECGLAYDPATDVFDGTVRPRDKNWVRDKLRLGILPRIEGIYRRQDLGDDPLESAEESQLNTAVFITHLHLDHMAFMGMIAPQVPVYLHHNAQCIERALEATGQGVETLQRTYCDIVPGQPVHVGAIEVLPILCKAKSYYDFAFFIRTPDGTVHWTGDLCLHGTEAEKTLRQMEFLKQQEVDVLLCDCTSFMDSVMKLMYPTMEASAVRPSPDVPPGMLSEREYYEGLFEHIKGRSGLCVFNYYQREMEDAEKFLAWAAATRRACVFEPDAAYIVWKFFQIEPFVYLPDTLPYSGPREQWPAWLKELAAHAKFVQRADIWANPAGYMLQNSYPHILELLSLPSQGAAYLHADGTPIGEFDPAYANLRRIVQRAGFEYVTFFCENYFGHLPLPGEVFCGRGRPARADSVPFL
ncbi:MAG: MBL fold metallo-hydrolase [Ruthenibacterium sp.]